MSHDLPTPPLQEVPVDFFNKVLENHERLEDLGRFSTEDIEEAVNVALFGKANLITETADPANIFELINTIQATLVLGLPFDKERMKVKMNQLVEEYGDKKPSSRWADIPTVKEFFEQMKPHLAELGFDL